MKTIKHSDLMHMLHFIYIAKVFNDANLKITNAYDKFFKEHAPEYHYSQFMSKPKKIVNYTPEYEECKPLIVDIIKNNTTQNKVLEIDFDTSEDFINVALSMSDELRSYYKEETFELEDQVFDKIRAYFVSGIVFNGEAWRYSLHQKTVYKYIPESAHQAFKETLDYVSSKRISANTMRSFAVLRDFFDVDDDEWYQTV